MPHSQPQEFISLYRPVIPLPFVEYSIGASEDKRAHWGQARLSGSASQHEAPHSHWNHDSAGESSVNVLTRSSLAVCHNPLFLKVCFYYDPTSPIRSWRGQFCICGLPSWKVLDGSVCVIWNSPSATQKDEPDGTKIGGWFQYYGKRFLWIVDADTYYSSIFEIFIQI